MKLLSILNLSNREKPGADSGLIFQRLLLGQLTNFGWDCVLASPVPFGIEGIRDVYLEVGSSKYDVRFRFNWDEILRILIEEKPDVVFVNQVELTSSFRAVLVTHGLAPRLITYCHYWPIYEITPTNEICWDQSLNHAGLAEVILRRILDAAITCDAFFLTSEFAKGLLSRAASLYHVNLDLGKIHLLPCPADPALLSKRARKFRGTNRVVYNHRLYKQYGTDVFISIAKELGRRGVNFVVTDFFGSRSRARAALDPDIERYRAELNAMHNVIVREDGDRRSIYRDEILETVDVGIAPFRKNANWSMSTVDCMGMGIPVVCPDFASFPEFALKQLLFQTREEAVLLIQRLLIDAAFWTECSILSQKSVEKFSAEHAASEFRSIISLLI